MSGVQTKDTEKSFPRLICLGVMGTKKREPLKIDDSPHEFISESPDQLNWREQSTRFILVNSK